MVLVCSEYSQYYTVYNSQDSEVVYSREFLVVAIPSASTYIKLLIL